MPQPERISSLLTDSLRQIKETLGQFLTGLPRFLLKWHLLRVSQSVIKSQPNFFKRALDFMCYIGHVTRKILELINNYYF